jgi:hypothetical protein
MITKAFKSGIWVGSSLLNSKLYKAAKRKGVWYYRLFISEDFAKTMGDIYDMNVLERKLKGLSRLKKRVFNIDDNGNIWDPATGEIFGNVNTLKETPATPKTQPKADFDFEHTASELIRKHYGEEDVNAIAGAVNQELMDKHNYITSMEEDEQIIDMINEYTANQR